MSFMWKNLKNQFRTPKSEDFPGVVVPLADAKRHGSVSSKYAAGQAPKYERGPSSPSSGDDKEKASAPSRDSDDSPYNAHTLEGLRAELDNDETAFGVNSTYNRKSKLINLAIQDMGMGRYQWQLFVLCGFGWFADNFWLQAVSLTLTPMSYEFGITETRSRFTTMAVFIGLCCGASFWGIASDVIGRRLAFNSTLFICGLFGISAGAAPSWIGLCALYSCMGLGVGGNLPVDGALFLEFLPFASGSLLTGLSVWWPIGSLVAALIGWGLIPPYSCEGYAGCVRENNMGWRYSLFTAGTVTLLMWGSRFFLFNLFESPKFLLSRGRQTEAIAVIHGLAYKNGKTTWLTEDILNELGGDPEHVETTKLSRKEIVQHSLSKFSVERIGPLFGHWKIAVTTCLLWFEWTTIGMAYPLFNAFLAQYIGANTSSTYTTYRNYAITNIVGFPGSILAIWTVNIKYIGRKGTMAFATMLTGVLVCLFTTSKDPNIQLALSSLEAFFQNISYGVLYAYTPEVFPAPQRGTGTGISSMFNRIAGLCAPLVAIYASSANPSAPIFASGGLFLVAFLSMLALPIETRGKQSL